MSISWPQGSTSWRESEWEQRVARETARQARIEAAFDRADECAARGELEQALECLDAADALSGGLPPAYRAQQAHFATELGRGRP